MTEAQTQTLASRPWPTEIRANPNRDRMTIVFDDKVEHELTAEMLRVMSPSAEVQGHSEAERRTVGGKKSVKIAAIEPVGNYAVRIRFDDGHATGIFTWDYLRNLGDEREQRWDRYLADLAEKGLSR